MSQYGTESNVKRKWMGNARAQQRLELRQFSGQTMHQNFRIDELRHARRGPSGAHLLPQKCRFFHQPRRKRTADLINRRARPHAQPWRLEWSAPEGLIKK